MTSHLLKNFIFFFLISALYLSSRFCHLTSLPVFGDEAIYVRWSQLIKNVETLRFVPLSDGKQPLFMWLTVPFFKLIPDPLAAGRLVSVFSGLALLWLLVFIVSALYHRPKSGDISTHLRLTFFSPPPAALMAAVIYLCLPFSFFFDRLALPDTLLSLLGALSLFLALFLGWYPRLDLAMLLGIDLGLAWITKSPAVYFVVLSVISYFFLNTQNFKKFLYPVISTIFALVIYNLLRLGPQFHQIALRNRDYIWSFSDFLNSPLNPLIPHLLDTVHIYLSYISLPIVIAFVTLLILNLRRLTKTDFLLAAWWLLPIIANSTFAKVYTARYILFTLPPFVLLTARLLTRLKHSWLVLFLLIPNLLTIHSIAVRPFDYRPLDIESGYFRDWTSGWGIRSAADYLKIRSQSANVIVGTEGYFGTLPDGLQIFTDSLPRLTIFGVGLEFQTIPDKLIDAYNHGDEVYLLLNRSRNQLLPDQLSQLTLVQAYPKPDGDFLDLFRL